MKTWFTSLTALTLSLAVTVAIEHDADACGGCFAPPGPSTQVTAHRMAFAVSAKRTVLWDQIQYVGAPTDFGWVLPIRGKVDVGVSSDELFARLENTTQPQITAPPPPTCAPPEKVCRKECWEYGGASDTGTSFSPSADAASVDVWSTSVVGPYEATQLSASDGTALRTWLTDNGYVLPASIGPVIDKYIAEGFGFLVIKLVPNSTGDNRMVPIRIGFDGASPSLPLRMIAAGSGAKVGIKLFVMGDGRWEAKNFPNEEVKTADLVWDWRSMFSNLGTLEISLLDKHKGNVFLTETSADISKAAIVSGLPAGTTTTEAGTVFSSITDQSELDAAFPAKTTMRITRMFAELPLGSLGTDLDLQASTGAAIPQTRQAPKGINFSCPTTIQVECPGISPDCSDPGSDGGYFGSDGGFVNPSEVPPSGGSGGSFGCASSSSSSERPASMTWALGTIAGLALFGAIRRRGNR